MGSHGRSWSDDQDPWTSRSQQVAVSSAHTSKSYNRRSMSFCGGLQDEEVPALKFAVWRR